MNSKNKADISYGSIEVDDDEFSPQNVKVRVTTMLDEDVLTGLKEVAAKKGTKYQTLLNKIARSYLFAPEKPYEQSQRIDEKIVRKIVREELKRKKKA